MGGPWRVKARAERSGLPTMAAMRGVMTSSRRDLVMEEKAAPMMTATGRSMTLPRRMKSRKPLIIGTLQCEPRIETVGEVYHPDGQRWLASCSGFGELEG